jgi:siroheme synthase
MAMGSRAPLIQRLLNRGWRPEVPAAIVVGASTAQMWTWRGTLGAMSAVVVPADSDGAPGTIVVGDVAGLQIEAVETADRLEEVAS